MGLKDKLINFFKNTKNLFSEPVIEVKEIKKPQTKEVNLTGEAPVITPEKYPHIIERPTSSLKPHQLYSPKPTNSHYSTSDVFWTKPPSQSAQKVSKTTSSSFNYHYTAPKINTYTAPKTNVTTSKSTNFNKNYSPAFQKPEPILKDDKQKAKHTSKLTLKPFCEYVVSCRTIISRDSSLELIVPNADKQMIILKSKNDDVIRNSNYLKVEEGDFVANLNNVNKSNKKFSVAIYRGKETVLTSNSFFVFRVKSEILNRNFLELLIKDQRFDDKLAFLAFKFSRNNQISWESFSKNLFLNIPSLKAQKQILEEKEALQELIEIKQSICRELDEWMKNYFYFLSKDEKVITKNFKELFSIERKAGLSIPKLKDLQNQLGKFIFSSFKKLIVESCELCHCDFCESDKLLLSAKIYGEDEQKHILNLWIGCVGFASSSHFITLTPHEALGVPYSYWLLRENLNNLVKNIPSIASKRTVSIVELRNCDFDLLPESKIKEFNNVCEPIFQYQQALEEEIYKLTKLKEEEIDTFLLRTFSKKISWNLPR